MNPHYRHRAAPAAPTPNDLRLWRALLDKAEKLAIHPERDPLPLMRAGDRAAKARMPLGHQNRESAFMRLVVLAKMYWRLAPTDIVGGRINRAGELADLAKACREILDPPPDASAARKPRADIFG